MVWLNRLGLLFDFLAFWFAAPEILGEKRLKAIEAIVERFFKTIPIVIFISTTIGTYVFTLTIFDTQSQNSIPVFIEIISTIGVIGFLVWNIVFIRADVSGNPVSDNISEEIAKLNIPGTMKSILLISAILGNLSLCILLGWLLIGNHTIAQYRIGHFSMFRLYWAVIVASMFALFFAWPIKIALRRMANDEKIRQRSLLIGTGLFIVGFVLQMVSTF